MSKPTTYRIDFNEHIARVNFTQPERLNAITQETINELSELVKKLAEDEKTQVVIFSSSGEKAFIAGADIKNFNNMNAEQAWKFARQGQELFSALAALPQVTIAQVNGYALGGGCEFALACDLIYANTSAVFGQPEVGLGIIPGFGGTVRLMHRVGAGRAKELIFRGHKVTATQALEIGLVEAVFSPSELDEAVAKIAKEIIQKSPYAITQAKRSLYFAKDHDLSTAMQYEAELFSNCFKHPDQKEGVNAFMEKRLPQWKTR